MMLSYKVWGVPSASDSHAHTAPRYTVVSSIPITSFSFSFSLSLFSSSFNVVSSIPITLVSARKITTAERAFFAATGMGSFIAPERFSLVSAALAAAKA